MKKLIKFIIVVAIVVAAVYFPLKMIRDKNREAARIENIKNGMYIEVVYEDTSECTTKFKLSNQDKNYDEGCAKTELNVRKQPVADGKNDKGESFKAPSLGTAKKGEIYKVVEVDETDPKYIWFRIIYQKNWKDPYVEGYVAQPRTSEKWVEAHNITFDYSNPTINYDNDEYEVDSIEDITYDHLRVWDDQDGYTITHEVFIERQPTDRPGPQYWIKYTVTDKKGKTASKSQRIIFKNPPSDSKVKDFSLMRNA